LGIYNLGSINIDHFYQVPNIPKPGETLAASAYFSGVGGKGANQSVAAARAGSATFHIGAIGRDGLWIVERLASYGVNIENVAVLDGATAHAIINVDPNGENAIVIFSATNLEQDKGRIAAALSDASASDIFILQNETSLVEYSAQYAREKGMRVVYSAAPFDAEIVRRILPYIDILVLNEVEADQLSAALGVEPKNLPVDAVLTTRGADGATYQSDGAQFEVAAFSVTAIDTTGAGDTYLGYFVASLDAGMDVKNAMILASGASAIQVMRVGTADAIPALDEVKQFIKSHG
jgi:ribokinase